MVRKNRTRADVFRGAASVICSSYILLILAYSYIAEASYESVNRLKAELESSKSKLSINARYGQSILLVLWKTTQSQSEFYILKPIYKAMKKVKERALNTDVGEVHFASLYSSLHTVIGHEWRTQPNGITNESLSELFDFPRWHNDPRVGTLNETAPSLTSVEDTPRAESVLPKKSQQYLHGPSYRLLQKLQENKVNLIVVATSLDESEIVKKLNTTLDPETCSMIPLPFTDVGASKYRSDTGSSSEELDTEDDEAGIGNENVVRAKRISRKRKSEPAKDTRYWKRRNSNNEAAKRSRLAKRSRFVWIEEKTKELEEENIKLSKQLKSLESRVSELEARDAKQEKQKE